MAGLAPRYFSAEQTAEPFIIKRSDLSFKEKFIKFADHRGRMIKVAKLYKCTSAQQTTELRSYIGLGFGHVALSLLFGWNLIQNELALSLLNGAFLLYFMQQRAARVLQHQRVVRSIYISQDLKSLYLASILNLQDTNFEKVDIAAFRNIDQLSDMVDKYRLLVKARDRYALAVIDDESFKSMVKERKESFDKRYGQGWEQSSPSQARINQYFDYLSTQSMLRHYNLLCRQHLFTPNDLTEGKNLYKFTAAAEFEPEQIKDEKTKEILFKAVSGIELKYEEDL